MYGEYVDDFLESIFVALFPNIDSPAGRDALEAIASYMMKCEGDYLLDNCPKLFECVYLDQMAYLLAVWGFTFVEEGEVIGITVPPLSIEATTYLKKRTVGRETCELAEVTKCLDCNDKLVNKLKSSWKNALEKCRLAHTPMFMGGGTYYGCRPKDCGCGSEKKR